MTLLSLRHLIPGLAIFLTLLFYGVTLTFPLYWDDAANFRFFDPRTFGQLWTDAGGFPYYRPVLFTLWRALNELLGRGQTVLLHGLNLTAHAANGWLAGLLIGRLLSGEIRLKWLAAAAAAAFSVLFPFAPVAVSLVASLFHIFLLTVSLGVVSAFVEFHITGRRAWAVLGLALCLVAPFVHEAGIMVGSIGAWTLLVLGWRKGTTDEERGTRESSRRITNRPFLPSRDVTVAVAAVLASAVFLPVWLAVPKSRGGFEWVGWESIVQSTIFFFEGFTFPVQPLARPLMALTGWSDMTAIVAVGLPALVGAALVVHGPTRRLSLLGLGWYGLAALPSVLVLGFYYIVTSTRLMVFPSGGAVLFWAVVLSAGVERLSNRPRVATLTGSLALALSLAVPAFHIVREMRLHASALQTVWDLTRIASAHPGERHLLVNPPDWVAYRQAVYALGHEGVEIKSSYVSFDDLAYINGADKPILEAAHYEAIKSDVPTHYYAVAADAEELPEVAARLDEYGGVWLVEYSGDSIETRMFGRVSRDADPAGTVVARFEGTALENVLFDVQDNQATVQLSWHVTEPVGERVAFVHVFDCTGNVIGLADSPPMQGMYPFWLAKPGNTIMESRLVDLDSQLTDSCVYFEVGLFDPATGLRIPAFGSDGNRLDFDLATIR